MKENTGFVLFHLPGCPYCVKARRAAERLGVEIELVDISRVPAARAALLEARGRATVPVLQIGSGRGARLLPESDAIVSFLEAWKLGRSAA